MHERKTPVLVEIIAPKSTFCFKRMTYFRMKSSACPSDASVWHFVAKRTKVGEK